MHQEVVLTINFVVCVIGLTICVLGLIQAVNSFHMEKKTRRYLIIFFSILALYIAFNLFGQLTDNFTYRRLFLFFESTFSAALAPILTRFLLSRCGEENGRHSRPYHLAVGLWGVYMVLLVSTYFTRWIYYYDETGYHRGAWYPVLLVPPILIMGINLNSLWYRRVQLSKKERMAFLVYCLAPVFGMLLQLIFFGMYLIVLGTAVGAMVMFLYIQSDQEERFFRQEEESAKLKIDILLAQIQPHFLYNSLTTIRYLCRKDPEKAERAVTEFSAYLRYNMDSLAKDSPIPFEEELKHVEAYLELQRLRFGKDLSVTYDLKCRDFCMPALTLQPLVENAVTYGIRKNDSGAGTVTIGTVDIGDHIEITVRDNGPGFVYGKLPGDTERSHNGIKNVKERLGMVSGASLVIDSEIGRGTVVTIRLPREEI